MKKLTKDEMKQIKETVRTICPNCGARIEYCSGSCLNANTLRI